jgi:protoporphyrinogen oxidase
MPVAPEDPIVIIGAGPCGLACARELDRLGHRQWLILERHAHAGGLASSVTDAAGFTWDLGGHVVFSHFGEFDQLLREAMGEEILSHERSSYVRFDACWVPYPFQNNLHHLPTDIAEECLDGLAHAPGGSSGMDFATWMQATFGPGITRHFMLPYNRKVWATEPDRMASGWIAERVAVIDYARAEANFRLRRDDRAWGPNNRFVFPRQGGTGEIYRRLAAKLADRVHYREEVVQIDPAQRTVRTAGGSRHRYAALVSTIPLDLLVTGLKDCPDAIRAAAGELVHNSVYMVGVGYRHPLSDDRSWVYVPDDRAPFYRVTNFAKYSPAHVPQGDTARYCAYMTETAFGSDRQEPRDGLERRVEAGLEAGGFVAAGAEVASIHVEKIPYAYPIPTLERDASLAAIQPWLMERQIYSRGRFGSWRYEMGNMDHAAKMGSDAARRLVGAGREELWQL